MKIVLATGGTGGHLFPAIKVAEELRRSGDDVVFCGSFRVGRDLLEKNNFHVFDLGARAFSRSGSISFLHSLFNMIGAIFYSFKILWKLKPQVVCGFGGYGSFPVVCAAVCLGIKTIIHEQNVIPGRANALLGRMVKKVALSFEEGAQYFSKDKTVLTGCPTFLPEERLSKKEAQKFLKCDELKFTIMVMGGSQGSQFINDVVSKVCANQEMADVQFIHLSGKHDFDALKSTYDKMDAQVYHFDFYHDIEKIFAASDLFIGRSGALTVTEVALQHIPAIFIPYPNAQGDHQRLNAELLKRIDAASIIDQKMLTVACLVNEINQWRKKIQGPKFYLASLNVLSAKVASQRLAQEIKEI